MNYETEIRMFNQWLEIHELSTSGIALWYALMFMAYRSDWAPELTIPVSALCLHTKLSRSAIYKERNILRDYGLLEFDAAAGRRSTCYRIRSFEKHAASSEMSTLVSTTWTQREEAIGKRAEMSTTTTQPWTQIPAESDEPPEMSALVSTSRTQTGNGPAKTGETSTTRTQPWTQNENPYISINKNIRRDQRGYGGKRRSATSCKGMFDLSFITDVRWLELVKAWLDYKQSRGEKYKSELSVKKFHTMLRNLSRGDPDRAAQIIDKSIANNWAGIFELPESSAPTFGPETTNPSLRRSHPASGQRIGQIKQPADEERRRRLLQNFGRTETSNDETNNR